MVGAFQNAAHYLTGEEIGQEHQFLSSLGFRLPPDGFLRSQPFAEPYSSWSLVVPTNWYARRSASRIAPRSLYQDLPLLRNVLEKAYSGWEVAAQLSWDWDSFFEKWRQHLTSCRDMLVHAKDAFAPWSQFQAFLIDNHSGPKYDDMSLDFARTAYSLRILREPLTAWRNDFGQTGKLNPLNAAGQPWDAYLWNDSFNSFTPVSALSHPASQGRWTEVYSGGHWHQVCETSGFEQQRQESVTELLGEKQDRLGFRRLSRDTGYLRIPTLSYAVAKQAEDQQKELVNSLTMVANIVVDLRGNQGGAAAFVQEIFDFLTTSHGRAADVSLSLKQSCLVDSLQWGFAQNYLSALQGSLAAEVRLKLQALMDQIDRNSDCTVTWQHHSSMQNFAQHRFPADRIPNKPRLIILTDGNCGSDGEFLVYKLALLPNSVVVGTCTGGVGGFARPGYFTLPNSRVTFRLASGITDIYGDGRSFDGYGLRVDILPCQQSLGPDLLIKLVSNLSQNFDF